MATTGEESSARCAERRRSSSSTWRKSRPSAPRSRGGAAAPPRAPGGSRHLAPQEGPPRRAVPRRVGGGPRPRKEPRNPRDRREGRASVWDRDQEGGEDRVPHERDPAGVPPPLGARRGRTPAGRARGLRRTPKGTRNFIQSYLWSLQHL